MGSKPGWLKFVTIFSVAIKRLGLKTPVHTFSASVDQERICWRKISLSWFQPESPKVFSEYHRTKYFFTTRLSIIRVIYSIVSENIRCYIMKLGSPTASNQEAQPRRIDQKRLWLFFFRISKNRNRRDREKQKKTWWGGENVCVLFEWNFLLENLD